MTSWPYVRPARGRSVSSGGTPGTRPGDPSPRSTPPPPARRRSSCTWSAGPGSGASRSSGPRIPQTASAPLRTPQGGRSSPATGLASGPTPGILRAPAHSGSGKRIVWDKSASQVWLVDADNTVRCSYVVTDNDEDTPVGTYRVRSKSAMSSAVTDGRFWRLAHMVRFYLQPGHHLWIGFHAVPQAPNGDLIQPMSSLGKPGYRSHGCVRQHPTNAANLYAVRAGRWQGRRHRLTSDRLRQSHAPTTSPLAAAIATPGHRDESSGPRSSACRTPPLERQDSTERFA